MDQTDAIDAIRSALKSQYHAALAMLRDAVQRCPDALWTADDHTNAIWQLAYHTLFFTHLYLQPDEAAFRPWEGHQSDVQHPDAILRRVDATSELAPLPEPYTKDQILAYWRSCDDMVDDAVDALGLLAAESGFHWYRMPKLDLQIVNVRHIQHHAGQLADRLRAAADVGGEWVGARAGPTAA